MRRVTLIVLSIAGSFVATAFLCDCVFQPMRREMGEPVVFPGHVSNTTVQVEAFKSYDGPYVEDGSRRNVSNVATVILCNTGEALIHRGTVKLWQGERELVFAFSMIPPGARVLVMEADAKSFFDDPVTGCWGWTLTGAPDNRIRVEEAGRTSLSFLNLTDGTVDSAVVWFKDYDPEDKLLIGGISYRVEVQKLKPGHKLVIPVFQYISGKSMLVG